jgi:hypothetical protein
MVNGALVCADLGLLAPGFRNAAGLGTDANPPGSPWSIGLRLNYDGRPREGFQIPNDGQVELKRSLWNPISAVSLD